MDVVIYPHFTAALGDLHLRMKAQSQPVHAAKWQSIDVSKRPEAEMRELINVMFQVAVVDSLESLRLDIRPNLPWADDHFEEERSSGQPINPGETWKRWPWGHSAEKFLDENGKFAHTYAERFWPKFAGNEEGRDQSGGIATGVRFPYGDLADVVDLLAREPLTRQAYVPIWFPEDTGVVHGERVPCTLGYHFMQRGGFLHVFYPIRSCDFVRHFRDDLYLACRLLLWILMQLRNLESPTNWDLIKPGMLTFWAGSMHCFINDWRKL